MPIADEQDQISMIPVGSARGAKIVLDTAKPYVGNEYVWQRVNSTSSQATTLCIKAKFDLLTPVPRPNEFLVN